MKKTLIILSALFLLFFAGNVIYNKIVTISSTTMTVAGVVDCNKLTADTVTFSNAELNETIGDGKAKPFLTLKTLKYTISGPYGVGYDYTFNSGNSGNVQVGGGNIIPPYAQVISIIFTTTYEWSWDGNYVDIKVGTSSGGTQYIAATTLSTVGTFIYLPIAGALIVAPSASATSVWLTCARNGGGASFTDFSYGAGTLYITYIDPSSAN